MHLDKLGHTEMDLTNDGSVKTVKQSLFVPFTTRNTALASSAIFENKQDT